MVLAVGMSASRFRETGSVTAARCVVAQDAAIDVDPLALPKAFVGAEEERPVPHDRSAQVGAELIAAEQRLRRGRLG